MDILSIMARMIELGSRCYAMTFEEAVIDVAWSFGKFPKVFISTDFNATEYTYHDSEDLVEWVAGNFAHTMAEELAGMYGVPDPDALYRALRFWVLRCYAADKVLAQTVFVKKRRVVEWIKVLYKDQS